MSDIPWVKFYPADFLNGVADLSPNEIAVYTVVLMRIYDEDRAIPNDVEKVSRRCNMRVTQCRKAINSLIDEGKLIVSKGGLDNPRAQKERESRHKLSKKQAFNARRSEHEGSKKPNKNNGSGQPWQSQNEAKTKPRARVSRSQKPEPEGERKREKKNPETDPPPYTDRGARIAEDWTLSDDLRRWAEVNTPTVDVDQQAALFLDHYLGATGTRGLRVSWDATFRNWLRRSPQFDRSRAQTKKSPHQNLFDSAAELAREFNQSEDDQP